MQDLLSMISEPESLQYIGVYFRITEIFDRAEEIAISEFGSLGATVNDKKFHRRLQHVKGERKNELGIARNFNEVAMLYRKGHNRSAEALIKGVSNGEGLIRRLNHYLSIDSVDYATLCIEQKKLLSFKELDRILIERFAPGTDPEFFMREGIAVQAKELPGGDAYTTLLIEPEGSSFRRENYHQAQLGTRIRYNKFAYEGDSPNNLVNVSQAIEREKGKKFAVIQSKGTGVPCYFLTRYTVQKLGKAIAELLPEPPD